MAAAVAIMAACDSRQVPTAPEPPPPSDAELITETFGGSLGPGEMSCRGVSLAAAGRLRLTLLLLEPPELRAIGLGVGTPGGASGCTFFAEDDDVGLGDVLLADELEPGAYCTCALEVGDLGEGETATFELQLEHP